jgi:hypothetical protein
MSYSDAGKGSKQRKTNRKQYDENYDLIFGRKDKFDGGINYDSDDESNSWNEDKVNIIGINSKGDHYIK